jgi:TonB-dependent receptor
MRFTFTLMLCLSIVANALAQGTLKGKITDEKTGETLVGVTISIPELKTVAAFSDEDGDFELKVPDGNYTVQVRYMGYVTKEISDVKIETGTITPMTLAIKEEGKTNVLKDVVVRSTLKKESLNALYIAQKNSASVSDGISAEAIKKSPDKSTGEVLKRVSGTTIQDNKFVIIRGLTDRYNTALIDNAFLPSTEPNRKAFSFDIIPSSLIDNIIISKSGTPDLPGDFAGGVINILTKEIPDKNFNSISIGSSYNTYATFKDFKTGYKSSTDIIGFDNGARQLPKDLPSYDYFTKQNVSLDASKKYLSMLNNDYTITDRKANMNMSLQGSLGRLYELKKNRRIGVTGAINYSHSEGLKKDVERIYGNYNYLDQVYQYNTTVGALANVAYSTTNSKISFKNLYNRTFDDNYLYREGYDGNISSFTKYYAFDLVQKSLFKTTLEGEHSIAGDAQKKLNWVASYNNVTNNQPDQRKVQYKNNSTADAGGDYSANVGTLSKANNRLFGHLNESIINTGLSYSTPYKLNFLYKSSLKLGGLFVYRNRDFANRYLGAIYNNGYAGDGVAVLKTNVQSLYNQSNINNGVFEFQDLTAKGDEYTAQATTSAAYVMSDNRINTRLRAVWGIRFESYALNLQSPGLTNALTPVWNDLMPSLNMSYALTEKSNLRMSYFRSIARPELREISPIAYYDYELNLLIEGNKDLTRSRIDNFDLRYEVFPRPGEVISGSVFYKNFNKTIENYFYGVTSSPQIATKNYDKATNIGVEFELRKNLDFIVDNNTFRNLTFYANLALIKSNVALTGDDKLYLINSSRDSRAMSGQSPYVINTSLAYSALSGKLNFNVLYNRIGQRIYIVGGNGQFGDVYESPRNILDFQASLNVGKRSEFRVNVKDMLNARTFFYYDQTGNKKYDDHQFSKTYIDPNQDYIFQRYRQGTTFSLTYTYKF